jgi:hypothetical protein
MKYWASAHSDMEANQLQQGAAALIDLALGAGGRKDVGNAARGNSQLMIEQGEDAMDTDAQDNATDDDNNNMQT